MPKRTKVEGPATTEEIDAGLKTHSEPYQQNRLLAVRMAQQGKWTRAQIGEALGKGRATITPWLAAYRTGGIEALLKRGYLGKEPTLSPEDINAARRGTARRPFQNCQRYAPLA